MNPLTMGVTMLGTAEVVMLAGGELRPAGKQNKTKKTGSLLLDREDSAALHDTVKKKQRKKTCR